jgi:hypothetical protein
MIFTQFKPRKGMKMKKISIVLIAISLLTLTLVGASGPKEKVGERFFFPEGTGTMVYPANEPFHISHGWNSEIGGTGLFSARGGLRLEIDGITVEEDFIEHSRMEDGGILYRTKRFIYNFPEGMTGVHTFDFFYVNICRGWIANGYVDECTFPNKLMEFHIKSWVVTFE